MSASATKSPGQSVTPPGSPGAPGSPGKGKPKLAKGKPAGFLANSKREMQIEYMGESTPGPGSYLPASTFGVHGKPKSSKTSKLQSSAFKSASSQRPQPKKEHVPGPGGYSPNHLATSREKKKNNPGSPMKSKGDRFSSPPGDPSNPKQSSREPGPGYYDAHTHKTIVAFLNKKRELQSRQNPGFGASSPAHTLPYEIDIANDQKAFTNSSTAGLVADSSGAFGAGGASFAKSRRNSTRPVPSGGGGGRGASDVLSA